MFNKAIVVVSFGTSVQRAYENGIMPIEKAITLKFDTYNVVSAYTSRTIRNKLKTDKNIIIDSPVEAIEKLIRMGYADIIIQPTLIIPGIEYDRLQRDISQMMTQVPNVNFSLGKPLLYSEGDLKDIMSLFVGQKRNIDDDTALVYMGHGTEHFANSIYYRVLYDLKIISNDFYMTVVESVPSFEDIATEIAKSGIKKAILKPFMIVAGDHAINDMSSDDSDSLKSLLQARGVQCECVLEGLGSSTEVQDIFIKHINELL